jgi:anti-sigma factor (TIGR02949 family)
MTPLDRYTCEEAFRRIDDYLDRELTPEEMRLVQSHLEICEGCAREFRFEASVLQGVKRKLRQIDVPADFQSRLLAALGREAGR